MWGRRRYAQEMTRLMRQYRIAVLEWECGLTGATEPGPPPARLTRKEHLDFIANGVIPRQVLRPSTFDVGYG